MWSATKSNLERQGHQIKVRAKEEMEKIHSAANRHACSSGEEGSGIG